MSTDKVDAREAYLAEAKRLLSRAMFAVAACDSDAMKLAGDAVMEHLRTQPEGYRMVPVEPTPAILACIELEWIANGSARKNYASLIAAAQEGK